MIASNNDNMSSSVSDSLNNSNLNDRLDADCLDVPKDDLSIHARYVRGITGFGSNHFSPRLIIVILRLLKAITFCFLCLTLAADIMYLCFVEIVVSNEVGVKLGGNRDKKLRLYGVILTIVALAIELDLKMASRHFAALKGFVPRGMLLHFIAVLTSIAPLSSDDVDLLKGEIPQSSVVFQAVASFILGVCALAYVVLGVLCLDRLTSDAFISKRDLVSSTAIPPINSSSQRVSDDYQRKDDNDVYNGMGRMA